MNMPSDVQLSELPSRHLPGPVPYAVIAPSAREEPLPLCIVLMGGGGTRQSLVDCRPLFDQWWAEGALAPMALATPSPGMGYYIEDPNGERWESFLLDDFMPHFQASSIAIMGISMGGYGALKTAFANPERFAAVAAMNPMLEPGLQNADIGPRNRIHHASGGPSNLIGPARDPDLFAANNPANRAIANAGRIRDSALPIYIEAGDNDFVNAHDGAEFLHRVLWDLDLSHEYRLLRGADHGGPTFRPRMKATFEWLTAVFAARVPTAASPEQVAFDAIRAQLDPLRDKAAVSDPTAWRRFGVLPR